MHPLTSASRERWRVASCARDFNPRTRRHRADPRPLSGRAENKMSNASAAPRAAAATTDDIEAAPTLDSLPPEVLGVAFCFLLPSGLMPLTKCSRQWRATDLDTVYWKPRFLLDFGCALVVEEMFFLSYPSWQQRYNSQHLFLQIRVREVLGDLRRVRVRSVQSLSASRRLAEQLLRSMVLGHRAYFSVGTPETDMVIFETTFTRIQDIGQNHVSALCVETNSLTALPVRPDRAGRSSTCARISCTSSRTGTRPTGRSCTSRCYSSSYSSDAAITTSSRSKRSRRQSGRSLDRRKRSEKERRDGGIRARRLWSSS